MLQQDVDLTGFNTLALSCTADFFAAPEDRSTLGAVLAQARAERMPVFVLGQGSNLVMGTRLPGIVIQPRLRGVRYQDAGSGEVLVDAAAGESWDGLVADSVARQLHGIENLSLIPGTVGAAPLQNIGAYGVELADVLDSLLAVHIPTGEERCFSRQECGFAYRDSFFRSVASGEWLILSVRVRLSRQASFRLGYANLRERFESLPAHARTLAGVRRLICDIRREKLPDVSSLPNAGSFFRNPLVDADQWRKLCQMAPGVAAIQQADGRWKVAAAWLIEHCGWKGRRLGPVGMHEHQALVMINYGGATVDDVRALADAIKISVRQAFGIELEQEPVSMP